jgi:hypothetical protein
MTDTVSEARDMTTPAQVAQMVADTTIDAVEEVAIVRDPHIAEDDPRFYLDYEWLAWFVTSDYGKVWTVDGEMRDGRDPDWSDHDAGDDVIWTVPLARRRP